MKNIAIIAGVFFCIYIKMIYSAFFSKSGGKENFFVNKDSLWLNETQIENKIYYTGTHVRQVARIIDEHLTT